MARKTTSVDELYANRHRPYGQVRDPGARHRVEHSPSMESGNTKGSAFNRHVNQSPEDKHDDKAGYDNDTSGWIKGAGEDATRMPGFDKSNPWRKGK
jgi:hypothetical protein